MTKLLFILSLFYFLFACVQTEKKQTDRIVANTLGVKNPEKQDSLLQKISGIWKWKHSGSNWGIDEEEKPGVLERKLLVRENGEMEFYENDSLMRTERFTVSFLDETAVIYFLPSGEQHTCLLEGTQLVIGGDPFCACGCLVNVYAR